MIDKILSMIYNFFKWCWAVFLTLLAIEITLIMLTVFVSAIH